MESGMRAFCSPIEHVRHQYKEGMGCQRIGRPEWKYPLPNINTLDGKELLPLVSRAHIHSVNLPVKSNVQNLCLLQD